MDAPCAAADCTVGFAVHYGDATFACRVEGSKAVWTEVKNSCTRLHPRNRSSVMIANPTRDHLFESATQSHDASAMSPVQRRRTNNVPRVALDIGIVNELVNTDDGLTCVQGVRSSESTRFA